MRNIFRALLCIILISSKQLKAQNTNKVIFDRIEFVFNLKQTIDNKIWASFNEKKYDVPLVYFTDSSSYAANPTERFLSTFKSKLVYTSKRIKIYKTNNIIDGLPFHMFTGMSTGTPTKKYDYHSPFMKCSSFEIAKRAVPEILSTEEWVTWISHEYFHGFQYKHTSYLNYLEKSISTVNRDSLQSIYKRNAFYKLGIDKENNLLLQAINETNIQKMNIAIDSFFLLRQSRRMLAKEKMGYEIEKYEKTYETMEGTARYVEYSLYKEFENKQPDNNLIKSDSSFKSFNQFKNFKLDTQQWLYITEKSGQYFYASGFNIARLLDKLQVEYKLKLFNKGGLSLEEILKAHLIKTAAK